ncbi:hypothetical protein HY251_15715 [bacterium]|nr:hypothetical protein [bacterium]
MPRRPFGRRSHRPRRSDPQALARERARLGALLLTPEAILWTGARTLRGSFADRRNDVVMQALVCTASARGPVTVDSVVETLADHEALEHVGGRAYVDSLVAPSQLLEQARARLRETFVPVEREPIVVAAAKLLGAEPWGR